MTTIPVHSTTYAPSTSSTRWMLWIGRILSVVPILMMVLSAAMKLSHNPKMLAMWTSTLGFPERLLVPIGLLELVCALLYAIPQTALLGAILVSAYFGGAVATHVKLSQDFVIPLLLGICAWAGLFLRDARLRDLFPLRTGV